MHLRQKACGVFFGYAERGIKIRHRDAVADFIQGVIEVPNFVCGHAQDQSPGIARLDLHADRYISPRKYALPLDGRNAVPPSSLQLSVITIICSASLQ